jgi:hypothetical protein
MPVLQKTIPVGNAIAYIALAFVGLLSLLFLLGCTLDYTISLKFGSTEPGLFDDRGGTAAEAAFYGLLSFIGFLIFPSRWGFPKFRLVAEKSSPQPMLIRIIIGVGVGFFIAHWCVLVCRTPLSWQSPPLTPGHTNGNTAV